MVMVIWYQSRCDTPTNRLVKKSGLYDLSILRKDQLVVRTATLLPIQLTFCDFSQSKEVSDGRSYCDHFIGMSLVYIYKS